MHFDVATGSTQIMPSCHALNLAWGEHCTHTHVNSDTLPCHSAGKAGLGIEEVRPLTAWTFSQEDVGKDTDGRVPALLYLVH